MLDIEKFSFTMRLSELCKTFNEGITYIANHPDNTNFYEVINQGINALSPYLGNDIFEPLKKILSEPHNPEKFLEYGEEFLYKAEEEFYKTLLKLLNKEKYVKRPVIERLFEFLDNAQNRTTNYYNLMFKAAEACCVSMPAESFNRIITMIEQFPDMMSGKGMSHPNYIYRPSEQHTFEHCIICGGEGEPYYNGCSYLLANFNNPHLPFKLWMKCKKCGNMYTLKHPKAHLELSDSNEIVYPNEELFLTTNMILNGGNLSNWGNILNKLSSYTTGKKLLEVGIGTGELLAVALELNFKVEAVEIERATAQHVANLLGINIWRGDFLKFKTDKHIVVWYGKETFFFIEPMRYGRDFAYLCYIPSVF